ncbi:type II toxin-antitoxin system prevent-host-death family antitoxin [Patulibacter sp. NPDC049589]|uniref:type II toxin-antitoxin system Phd/YefM family antitoxin n=1 Tax=Patulibacter sp. NPDC049589 TaxID=3154731 RepID=UPI0034309D77
MDVAISTLRAELSSWIDRARAGEEVVVTDRGTPVVRLLAVEAAPLIDRLTREGVLGPPTSTERPVATATERVPAVGSVSDLISEHRR